MKFKNLIRAGVLFGVAAIMAGTIVVSSTQENQDDRSAQSMTEAGLTAGVTQALNVNNMESVDVTAGGYNGCGCNGYRIECGGSCDGRYDN